MNLKNLKIKNLITNLLIALAYPILKFATSKNRLLAFSDACFIIGLFLIIVGILTWLLLKGDFDITTYIADRVFKKEERDFNTFMKDQKEKRKDSFNYPFFCGIIMLILSFITALAV